MRTALLLLLITAVIATGHSSSGRLCHAQQPIPAGESTREAKAKASSSIPFQRLNQNASALIRDVVDDPSYFRRMPPQEIECDPEMFTFLVRRPEVMVNIWELMGITQVSTRRTSPFSFLADDGVGTTAQCELVYGDENLHIYYGTGIYDGTMTPRKVTGRCVCILQSRNFPDNAGSSTIAGTMDVFLKLDNFGADLLTRTFGPFVGKTADYNFVETARFMSQISQICAHNPSAAQGLASQLGNVDSSVRQEFAAIAAKIATPDVSTPTVEKSARRASSPLIADNPDSSGAVARRSFASVDDQPLQLSSSAMLQPTSIGPAANAPTSRPSAVNGTEIMPSRDEQAAQSRLQLQSSTVQDAAAPPPTAIWPRKHNIFMRR